nr:MAG TPA: hypothetical protein [Caudoviricetes sp.]
MYHRHPQGAIEVYHILIYIFNESNQPLVDFKQLV